MALSASTIVAFLFLSVVLFGPSPSYGRSHVISFRSPNLYPEGLAWDPSGDHFLVGSLRSRTILGVSDAGVVETIVSDPSLPENSTFLGLAVDTVHNRLLAVVQSIAPLPPFNALAAYDLQTRQRLFLSHLPSIDGSSARDGANDVAVDFRGNAYVTNSLNNFLWKVDADGEASIFSRSAAFTATPVSDPSSPHSFCGLNGIAYVSKGYLLVAQTNTGKMYKVDAEDGAARQVLLNEDLALADGVAVRKDGVVLVVSHERVWFLKSQDSWGEAVVYDKTDLEVEGFATSVVAGKEGRAYVLYGHLLEGIKGNVHRDRFRIAEVASDREGGDDKVWVYVLLGLGMTYFMVWRFQMKNLANNMNKKIN